MEVWDQIIVAITSFLCFLILHVLLWQNESIKYRGLILMWIVGDLSYVLIALGMSMCGFSMQGHFWVSVALYLCLLMFYTHLYVGIDKSVSVRILGELSKSPNKTLNWEELEELYSCREMVHSRLAVLLKKGWLQEENGKYRCLAKATKVVKINLFLKKVFLLKKTG